MPEHEPDVSRLADEVLADARRKAERRRKAAQRDAAKLVADTRAAAEAEAAKTLDDARRRADRERQTILATVDQEVRRRRLVRQEALLDFLIQAGFDRVTHRQGFDVRQVLMALVANGIRQMTGASFRLSVSAADRALVDRAFLTAASAQAAASGRPAPALSVDETPAPIAGGVIIRDADDAQRVDNSFEARRRRLGPQLREALAALIFPQ